jgi:hypothetical protein
MNAHRVLHKPHPVAAPARMHWSRSDRRTRNECDPDSAIRTEKSKKPSARVAEPANSLHVGPKQNRVASQKDTSSKQWA